VSDPLLRLSGLTKAYPGVIANSDVSFDIHAGEVHALLGENGAGKSTLVKMIYGLVKPDSGTMALNNAPFTPPAPSAARLSGVAMVFQHFSLFEALNVAENIALGMENAPKPRDLAAKIKEVSHQYGLPLDPFMRVGDLSAGERQRVEIIRCLLQNPKLLIMDEPTSVLTPQEVKILFKTLRQLKAEGTAILYISHKLEEIRALCDTATILRNLSLPAPSEFGTALKDISFKVRAGEILGIGGVAGNGQDELLGALSGEVTSAKAVSLRGDDISKLGPQQRRALGVLAAPEERLGHAAVPDMSLTENALLSAAVRKNLTRSGFLNWSNARDFAELVIKEFDVRTPGPANAARSLSGGNLQKFVIGREVLQEPDVLIVNQPTWGVDASAAAAIRQSLMDLTEKGAAVVVISQDLDELMEISDHFAALNEGRLSSIRAVQGLSVEEIGLMMGGVQGTMEGAA